MDIASQEQSESAFLIMIKIAGLAGIGFGVAMAFYLHHLDSQLIMPELEPDEIIKFRQYGYAITDKKYDPARIIITNQRVIILPTLFNAGPRIPDFTAFLSGLQIKKDRAFGTSIDNRFLLLKLKNKLVLRTADKEIAYMPNIGYPLPPLRFFNST